MDKFLGLDLVKQGNIVRRLRLKDELYVNLEDPIGFIRELRSSNIRADLFLFFQNPLDKERKYNFYNDWQSIALLNIRSYDHWWTKQINDKTRNMVRKAYKSGVEIKIVGFDESLIKGIKGIYDESPIRQGKRFRHFNKSLEEIRATHISFIDRSEFIGAYHNNELIGFAKLVHNEGYSSLMQIISKISAREKAPMNALIAKSVEICARKNIGYLIFGSWGKRSGPNQFKKHNAFFEYKIPRYVVPLNIWGRFILTLRLHKNISDHIPSRLVSFIEKKINFR